MNSWSLTQEGELRESDSVTVGKTTRKHISLLRCVTSLVDKTSSTEEEEEEEKETTTTTTDDGVAHLLGQFTELMDAARVLEATGGGGVMTECGKILSQAFRRCFDKVAAASAHGADGREGQGVGVDGGMAREEERQEGVLGTQEPAVRYLVLGTETGQE